jgi:hypothetical protein
MVSSAGFEYPTDCGRQLPPRLGLGFQLRTSSACQFVVLGAPVVLGGAPSCLDPPTPLDAVHGGIEGTLPNLKSGARYLVKALRNGPAVLRSKGDGLEDEKVEGALWEIHPI